MKANTLITLQIASIVAMAGSMGLVYRSIIATMLFVAAFVVFIRCSIYIEKNRKRLLREIRKG